MANIKSQEMILCHECDLPHEFRPVPAGRKAKCARWNILEGGGRKLLYSRTSTYRNQASDKGVEPVVAP